VNRYWKPDVDVGRGRGPTKSMCMWEKRHMGTGMGCTLAQVRLAATSSLPSVSAPLCDISNQIRPHVAATDQAACP
jgi:hypothetical protein